MKIFRIFIFFGLLFVLPQAFGQAKLEFESQEHQFGEIKEGTVASYEFKFKNTGNQPLIISNVRASCGCTTPYWTKDPVKPGETGVIKASYNSKSRPGAFNKTITVSSNAQAPQTILRIRGTVILPEGDSRKPSAAQMANSPKINIDIAKFNAGKVAVNQVIPLKIPVKNTGKSALAIVNITAKCRCIQIDPGTKRIFQPGEEGFTEILFRPRGTGTYNEDILVQSTDLNNPKVTLKLQAQVVESLENDNMMKEDKKVKF